MLLRDGVWALEHIFLRYSSSEEWSQGPWQKHTQSAAISNSPRLCGSVGWPAASIFLISVLNHISTRRSTLVCLVVFVVVCGIPPAVLVSLSLSLSVDLFLDLFSTYYALHHWRVIGRILLVLATQSDTPYSFLNGKSCTHVSSPDMTFDIRHDSSKVGGVREREKERERERERVVPPLVCHRCGWA